VSSSFKCDFLTRIDQKERATLLSRENSGTIPGSRLSTDEGAIAMGDFKKFYELAGQNDEIQKRLVGIRDLDEFARAVVGIARERGFTFTAEEVKAGLRETSDAGELTQAELDGVAGGMKPKTQSCALGGCTENKTILCP
jgi:predicted ribosomally synthesized peptide with nif11-like leader